MGKELTVNPVIFITPFILILILLSYFKKETIFITLSSVTFRDGAETFRDGAEIVTELRSGPLLAYILLLAHSPANRAVSADSGNNLLSNNAIKMKNK